ncbi:glycosyl hydrolase [Serinibacter arcticus]|uniref:Glycosyl hydrolase n=1 Tax=Serinibacter arcticus TaxID=1655435 RepID=A0A2U1ZW45_9MICO|nr:glycoside hydrolase family 3 N-terminal domain-containing protein [Serinibacter arcticus]PWD51199.1 glycosyl hydrolase [Serinibacter arcticus]
MTDNDVDNDVSPITAPPTPLWRDPAHPAADRAAALLAELTLEEKVAQLGSYWADTRGSDEVIAPMQDVLGAGRPPFADAVAHGIGHLTRVLGTTPVDSATGARKVADAQRVVTDASRLGIPAIAHEECLTGFTTLGATVYPSPLSWGATFDPELIARVGRAIGEDLRAVGVHQGLAPVLDVTRDYRWGRVEETIGEDPYLVGTIGAAYVQGVESAGVVATLKHFLGYSASRGGRNHAPVSAGPREVADVLLPPFEMALAVGGARSVMNSYSEIDGVPVGADAGLLTTVLRDQLGFEGTVVSDYWSIAFLLSKHAVAEDVADAGRLALTAGIDVELPDTGAYGALPRLVRAGVIREDLVDRAVLRVLRQKVELGLLDPDWDPLAPTRGDVDLDSADNRALAGEVAERAVVLLANDSGLLPLDSPNRVAVIGPCADDARGLLGCYSYPIHVLPRHPEHGLGLPVASIAQALDAELADTAVVALEGVPLLEHDRSGIAAAVAAARESDVVVAVVGDRAGMFGKGTSGEGCDAPDLELPGLQGELVEALLDVGTETGVPVVLVVASGRPYAVGRYRDRAAAIVQTFMPGVEGAAAIAGVLSGRVNPSGHLPVSVPATSGGAPHTYLGPALAHDGDRISNVSVAPAFPFGHGLAYTTFAVGDLELEAATVPTDGTVRASVRVTNTGTRAGSTVVQLYGRDLAASVTRPVLELLGYRRLDLDPGATRRVELVLHTDRLSFTGAAGHRVVEPGRVELSAGLSSGERPASAQVTLTGPERRVAARRVLVTEVNDDIA